MIEGGDMRQRRTRMRRHISFRRRLVRLSVRRQSPHLSLGLDMPDPGSNDPADVMRLGDRLVAVTLDYSTP